jgi:hypothetical protein
MVCLTVALAPSVLTTAIKQCVSFKCDLFIGGFQDQGDAKWIVIREQLRGHNAMPFGQPTATPGWPIGRPGVAAWGWLPLRCVWCF